MISDSDCAGAIFKNATGHYADFSRSRLLNADFSGADMTGINLHRVDDNGAKWRGTTLKNVRKTDKDLAAAETWQAPSSH
jgi:uncharacterized protein YjbI with pentapeptide repeats